MESAGVYTYETDLSQIIVASATAIGALVFNAPKGIINTRTFTPNNKVWTEKFGKRDPKISFASYAAMAFLERSNSLWNVRVTRGDHLYGGILLHKGAGGLEYENIAVNKPKDLQFTGHDDPLLNLAYLYQIGPGSYGKDVYVGIQSLNVKPAASDALVITVASTGGELPSKAQYKYDVTVVNTAGEHVYASATTDAVTSGAANVATLKWPQVRSAILYNVYRDGLLLGGVAENEFKDAGEFETEKVLPTSSPTVDIVTLNVFDYLVSRATPAESFDVSFKRAQNGFGRQTELGEVVNKLSNMISVENMAKDFAAVPIIYDIPPTALTGGSSGSAPTAGDYIRGWEMFQNTDTSDVTILIDGGYAMVPVQLAMDRVAHARGDAVAVLDVPSFQQEATKAVEFRKNMLNLNSNRSALYTPDVKVYDADTDLELYVPPSGHVAGVYANNDYVAEAWFAPAGLNRALLSIIGLAHEYEKGERDILAPNQVNYIRRFPGQGYAVWEQHTLQAKASSLSYVNVRRLLDVIQKAVSKALLYSVFDPNDDVLRTQITTMIEQFLDSIQKRRGINQFMVVCDSSNNSPQTYAENKLNVDVYVMPTLAAAKIRLNMVLMKEGMTFEEAIAAGGST